MRMGGFSAAHKRSRIWRSCARACAAVGAWINPDSRFATSACTTLSAASLPGTVAATSRNLARRFSAEATELVEDTTTGSLLLSEDQSSPPTNRRTETQVLEQQQ